MSNDELVYELIDVRKRYGTRKNYVEALRGITLSIRRGEFVAVMGPSGSGKTTLLTILGLLTKPTSGTVKILGRDVMALTDKQATLLRRKTIGFIFQTFNLVPWLTAAENVELALAIGEYQGNRRRRIMELLRAVGLEHRANHRPTELSGGEQQRVAIARALANNPSIILADEPTGNLDTSSGLQVMGILRSLVEEGKTVVMVTHDQRMAEKADRIVKIRDGMILGEVIPNVEA
ncbi:MAG TPA: ABC transporter ATP-binding protein [Candidatus Korarchaeota archaeon]|nr:ABC transporter ATP-binding protein [Candidatus Korarchaeota archaeon]